MPGQAMGGRRGRGKEMKDRELHPSEQGKVCKADLNPDLGLKYNATCISCGEHENIQLWPHRNGHGDMIGFVFGCDKCADIVQNVTMIIEGIRG